MQAMLQIQRLSKHFGVLAALSDIELTVSVGEVVGLIGLNGAGKTTLIKCLIDLHRADMGSITVDGFASTNNSARTKLSYMPEKFTPPDYMTGWDYLVFVNNAQRCHPVSQSDLEKETKIYCSKLEFDECALGKSVRKLSKGMLQKLGIIGCLLSDKPIQIFDEPMSGLDPKARVLFRDVVRELKSRNKTILLCTHILNDIETLCDRVGILDQGKLLHIGSPAHCCAQFEATNLEQAFLNCLETDGDQQVLRQQTG